MKTMKTKILGSQFVEVVDRARCTPSVKPFAGPSLLIIKNMLMRLPNVKLGQNLCNMIGKIFFLFDYLFMILLRTLLVTDPRRCEPKKFGGPSARARK